MRKVVFFNPISITVPGERIYARLGYRQKSTRVSPAQKEEVDAYIGEAALRIQLKGALRRVAIKEKTSSTIILAGGETLKSIHLASFLKGCKEALVMAATAGRDIVEAVRENTSGAQVTRGVVFDATASEMTDAALDWIMRYGSQQLRRENKKIMKKRYSCGYGDFSLEHQKIFYDLLALEQIGVSINDAYVLSPEKSVTAITGILDSGKA